MKTKSLISVTNVPYIALIIHGFNVWDSGDRSVGEIRSFFAALGIPYHILKYGHFGLWDTRTKNDNVALQVAEFVKNSPVPVIILGHSNGCCITHLAIELYEAKPLHCVFINPALDSSTILDFGCTYDIWHSPSDLPVRLAKYLPKANFRPWGDMGAVGSRYINHRHIRNFNKEDDYLVSSSTHSDVFSPEKVSFFAPLIVNTAITQANKNLGVEDGKAD